MKVLVDNFSVLAVEKCMLSNLADILSAEVVMRLDDGSVSAIAAESEEAMLERRRTTEKLTTLQEGLATLNHLGRQRNTGISADET